jgi:hypothetical protein
LWWCGAWVRRCRPCTCAPRRSAPWCAYPLASACRPARKARWRTRRTHSVSVCYRGTGTDACVYMCVCVFVHVCVCLYVCVPVSLFLSVWVGGWVARGSGALMWRCWPPQPDAATTRHWRPRTGTYLGARAVALHTQSEPARYTGCDRRRRYPHSPRSAHTTPTWLAPTATRNSSRYACLCVCIYVSVHQHVYRYERECVCVCGAGEMHVRSM